MVLQNNINELQNFRFIILSLRNVKLNYMKFKLIVLIIIMTATINSCNGDNSQKASAQPQEPQTKVLIKTSEGDINIILYNETPNHRDNFIKLVEEQYYDSVLFHRVIRDFMVQAGDPDSKTAGRGERLGSGGPDYTIPAEFIYPKYYHKRGALSAARQADQVNPQRNSSGSQFYIVTGKKYKERELKQMESQLAEQDLQGIFNNLCMQNRDTIMKLQQSSDNAGLKQLQEKLIAETEAIFDEKGGFHFTEEQIEVYATEGGTPFLDNQYTVFGEVTEGMDVVEKIQKAATDGNDRPIKDIRIISMELIK